MSGPVSARASDDTLAACVRDAQAAHVTSVNQQALRWQAMDLRRHRAVLSDVARTLRMPGRCAEDRAADALVLIEMAETLGMLEAADA